MSVRGKVVAAYGNMITASFETDVQQNEVAYVLTGEARLKSEVIRVRNDVCDMQVFEDTGDIKVGDDVEFTGNLLVVELGPGLLQQIYDGLQNPLPQRAEKSGLFLKRGIYLPSLDRNTTWDFTPQAKPGDWVQAGDVLGTVPEGKFTHSIFVPFDFIGRAQVKTVCESGSYTVEQVVAEVEDEKGQVHKLNMI